MKMLIQTVNGKVRVFDSNTGLPIEDIGRIDIYVNSQGKASAVIEFRNVILDIEATKYEKT